jgi:hypothetical protein
MPALFSIFSSSPFFPVLQVPSSNQFDKRQLPDLSFSMIG